MHDAGVTANNWFPPAGICSGFQRINQICSYSRGSLTLQPYRWKKAICYRFVPSCDSITLNTSAHVLIVIPQLKYESYMYVTGVRLLDLHSISCFSCRSWYQLSFVLIMYSVSFSCMHGAKTNNYILQLRARGWKCARRKRGRNKSSGIHALTTAPLRTHQICLHFEKKK